MVERIARIWWVWPAFMAVMGFGALIAAWAFYPGASEQTMFLGMPFGGECGFTAQTGLPCPQCGMTRSWVYTSRGDLLSGFTYNAAGAMLFLWLVANGFIGAIRLILRNPTALKAPWFTVVGGISFWLFVPYFGLWGLRLLGVNALPTFIPMY